MSCCCDHDELDATNATVHATGLPRTVRSNTTSAQYRTLAAFVHWLVPLATLALIPKCPACVAAYALLLTGVGLSFTAAAALRWVLIVASIMALAYLINRAFNSGVE